MLKEYDKAWAKYQESLKIVPLPLISWEFYNMPRAEQKEFNDIQANWSEKINYLKVKKTNNSAILVTDANFKIIFASTNIMEMNGYDYKEIIGNSPKMFQGKETSLESRKKIRIAIENLRPFKEVILNYKKNGEIYLCQIEAYPKFDKKGIFVNYIAFETAA
ncbi:PAS domain-containing protein [Flavobacterium jejuense]|uniref:PAS domain-containing protein n=1 Tax=Flavobacterium jejuense TaxID=1544455 RepID=A0ABX0IV25_9FLAO|nr:PAS domain-containing protein [Flavobacterium jejuense]NHN25659.1 PAS domain-containing protein [Flavobacterium jejuense]